MSPLAVAATQPDEPTAAPTAGATTAVTLWNLLSRLTGFARVLAMGAALGTTALGDTYQAANLVSNILFELLAGGMLSAVLVAAFVQRLGRDGPDAAAQLAARVLALAVAVLGVVAALTMVAAPAVMRALTAGVDDASRDARVELGAFILLFVAPQLILYAVGAVSTALLQANRRFVAAAAAPVANNAVVIATMLAFRAAQDGDTSLVEAGSAAATLLAGGSFVGVAAMSALPLVALRSAGHRLRPRWPGTASARAELATLARQGTWAAGHLGANQVLLAVTIAVAAGVDGGVVAFQIALTFFLLPHAVLANPVFTTGFPRFAADAAAGRLDRLAADVGASLRTVITLVAPAAALLVALAGPSLEVVRLGALDAAGSRLVADVLAGLAVGLVGYSGFFLLTRVAYALEDVRTPTVVNAAATAAGALAMLAVAAVSDGARTVVLLALTHAAVYTAATVALLVRVSARLPSSLGLGATVVRSGVAAAAAGLAAWAVSTPVDAASRSGALVALMLGASAGSGSYAAVLRLLRAPEIDLLRDLRPR